MDAKLVVVGGDAKPAEIKLHLPVIIGRGRQATLILPHPLVSRKHCEIGECHGYLVVRDLGSLNGTYVNHRRVEQAVLPPGGVLTLGGVSFQAVYSPSAALSPDGVRLTQPAVSAFSSHSSADSDVLPGPASGAPQFIWDSKGTEPAAAESAGPVVQAGVPPGENDKRTAPLTGSLPRPK